jgi:1,3-beta-galactosyl-N-acetylhexosamine phosphorylase
MEKITQTLIERWGADAIRDSDGTQLSPSLLETGLTVYSTLCLVREDQHYAQSHPDRCQQKFLISDPVIASSETVEIEILSGYCADQFKIDATHTPAQWWEVFDRTTGAKLDVSSWEYLPEKQTVRITGAKKWHRYTVSFLVYQIWDPISMNNHLTNNWTAPHVISVDPYHDDTRGHLIEYLDTWLETHPRTDVVRLTSIAYNFTSIYNDNEPKPAKRLSDWTGYHDCISVQALEDFAREKRYRLQAEDFVDEGYYCDSNRVPTRQYLDWMEFMHSFVIDFGRECVDHIHRAGKKAMMFFCDHWIGTEPYSPRFAEMGVDGLVNPCRNGIQLRRMADVPVDAVKEVRLYPYFFPTNLKGEPVFCPGADPVSELRNYWIPIRRAMIRHCVDRIGFGGYLHLPARFPEFLDYVAQVSQEFRSIRANTGKSNPTGIAVTVGVLNAWGALRSWIVDETADNGIVESLAGFPVNVRFFSFEEIMHNGIPSGIDVIVNYGNAGTSWSGGRWWGVERVITTITEWVHKGGGFIGIGEPSALPREGRFFQLADILGVEKETGMSRCRRTTCGRRIDDHFIMQDMDFPPEFTRAVESVYPLSDRTEVLAIREGSVDIAVNNFGAGRAVYFSGFGFSAANRRLLLRALYWAANKERQMRLWFSTNIHTECAAFEKSGTFVVFNNDGGEQHTEVIAGNNEGIQVSLEPYECRWFSIGT